MKVEFRTVTLTKQPGTGAPVDVSATTDAFSNTIISAEAFLRGFQLRIPKTKINFHEELVQIKDVAIDAGNRQVKVTGVLGIRDNSGDWDNEYSGTAEVVVIGVLADN